MKTRTNVINYRARAAMLLMLLLAITQGAWAQKDYKYISEVMLIGGTLDEVNALKDSYTTKGWTVIDQDLNAGCGSSSDYIYLLYKPGSTASPNHTFITDFYISNASGTAPDTRDYDGRRYKLVSYDGGDHFKSLKGDLNSNAGGDDIHLYYTTDSLPNIEAVSNIIFNATKSGALGKNGGSTGYDLNTGCGSSSDYIYMHLESNPAPKWVIQKSSDGTQCIVKGFASTDVVKNDIKAFPAIIDGAAVVRIDGVNFSDFVKLETIYFSEAYNASTIPTAYISSSYRCYKLKHIHIVDNNGAKVKTDELPASVTSIPESVFELTAIETLMMPNVSSIPDLAFGGCNSLTSVTMPNVTSIGKSAFGGCAMPSITIPSGVTSIGLHAFYECDSLTSVSLPSSVTNIGEGAFKDCDNLNSVTISGNPTIGAGAFPDATELLLKPRTITGDGTSWTTFYNDYANFKAQGAAKVFKATVSDGKVGLTEVKDKIVNAGTAVVLKTGESNNFVQLNRTTDTSSDTQHNDLYAVNAPTYIPNKLDTVYKNCTFYMLNNTDGVAFYRYSGDMMPQNEAFLALPKGAATPEKLPVVEVETLSDNSSNGATLSAWAADGKTRNVMLVGRTLWKDGDWNTLCLPFAMTANQVAAQLNPTKLMTLSTSSFSGGTLTLNFEDATTIEAGKPYIVKWTADGANIENPIFTGVTISNATAPIETVSVDFIGITSPVTLTGGDRTKLYLGAANTLYYPSADVTINSCRAYFELKGGISAGDLPNNIQAFVLNFGGEETDIITIENERVKSENESWFSIDGRKLTDKPSAKGIYINNGKKVIIK